VAEMTGLDVEYIWPEFPLALGRQYEQRFFWKYRIPYESIYAKARGNRHVIH
jgi:hypothetical protein